MVESNAYLLVGEDQLSKNKIIQSIKNKFFGNRQNEFDYEIVYGDDKDLSPHKLDEILRGINLEHPLKLVIIKKVENLGQLHKEILLKYLKKPFKSLILIFDCQFFLKDEPFFDSLLKLTKKLYFEQRKKVNVFDLGKAIERSNIKKALEILNYLLKNREEPSKIIGGIYWYWEQLRDRLSLDKFRKGLRILLEADLQIKTTNIREAIAVEMAVIRLGYLMYQRAE